MSQVKWLSIAEKKKKSPHVLFLRDHPFYFFGDRSCSSFFPFLKITSLASGFLSAVCLA